MLLSIVSASAISMITSPGLQEYGVAAVVGLIVLLSLKEVLSASEHWNKSLNSSFNLAIVPLFVCFACIVFCAAGAIV